MMDPANKPIIYGVLLVYDYVMVSCPPPPHLEPPAHFFHVSSTGGGGSMWPIYIRLIH